MKSTSDPFHDLDMTGFWEVHESYERDYTDDPLTPKKVAAAEQSLGYKLPNAYIALMKHKNGGVPVKSSHHTKQQTSWAADRVAITGIFSIGEAKPYSLLGEFGSAFWIEMWEYPSIGVYFADCPSAGHDMLCLDYRECGPFGEPAVVHVDQESDFKITFVAENFESFIRGLECDGTAV